MKGDEPFFRPPVHGLRHPQIFYYGHTPCLYINKLRVAGILDKPVNQYFEEIFEVGVDEMLWDDMYKNDMEWPTVSEVHQYRKQVYDTIVNVIMTHPSLDDEIPVVVDQQHPMWALFMSFEHERIHFETSSVLFRETPIQLLQKPENWPSIHPSAMRQTPDSHPVSESDYPQNQMIAVHENIVKLGKPDNFPSFGWDNEYGERFVTVPAFEASKYMITNGEFYDFVVSGGYRDKEYWCDDGWAWRTHRNMKWPFFWKQSGPAGSHKYKLRTIFEEVDMQWDWPVDVNYYEAKAFCRWKSKKEGKENDFRVLTEAEHHLIRHKCHNLEASRKNYDADQIMVTPGSEFELGKTGANINLSFSSHSPVNYFPQSDSGHCDVVGNAWEWTEDHFNPLDNFEVHQLYDDFSTPCFDGKHSMIVGGSFMSTGDQASVFARFHFRPHFLQHSGFRLAYSKDDAPATHLFPGNFSGQVAARDAALQNNDDENSTIDNNEDNVYESNELLDMYLGLHYPTSGEVEGVHPILPHVNIPNHGLRFPQRVANLLLSLEPVKTTNRALDIGCAVGGASFELAKSFDHVDAFDFSENFVTAAKEMQRGDKTMSFRIPIEAEIYETVQAVHEEGVTEDIRNRVNFFVGDACQLQTYSKNDVLGTYDGVIMSNLLCRLPDPIASLDGLPLIVNKGGVVVIVTPFSWLDQFTKKNNWLGGYVDPVTDEAVYSKTVLKKLMEDRGFVKIHEEEMPLVIREHQRKYQYIVSEASAWRKL